MSLFSEYFKLNKTQFELDFVNIPIDSDILLFVDPFAISQRADPWSQATNKTIISFFDNLIQSIRRGNYDDARNLLRFLKEPNETRLGFSREHPKGAGIGNLQADELFEALLNSSAVRTGFLSSIVECELMIDGISRDKISDLTTNVIRKHLAVYTKEQCDLFNIPTNRLPLPPYYNTETQSWISDYFDLPLAEVKPVLLVPKAIVRYDPAYDHQDYYSNYVLSYLQAEHLNANDSLVHTLKDKTKVVYKKEVARTFPCTKNNLYKFSEDHPEVLQRYRNYLTELEKKWANHPIDPEDERKIATLLSDALSSIPVGNETASDYHNLMIGIVEFLFFPNLLHPVKEREIHQGRKRIDIVLENGARMGIFDRLHSVRNLPCPFIVFECKNYGREVANPELDQISGRFSDLRGKFGILCCRNFQDRPLFIERCRDTIKDGRGLVIPMDDNTIKRVLQCVIENNRDQIDTLLTELINEVWLG